MKISHEAMLLDLEDAFIKKCENDQYYNLSAHFLWIGYRTSQIDHAHVEQMRGIQNPIGIKIGTQTTPENLIQIVKKLNPNNEVDKLIIIPRLGAENISLYLPKFIKTKKEHGLNFIWMLDPMHANTKTY